MRVPMFQAEAVSEYLSTDQSVSLVVLLEFYLIDFCVSIIRNYGLVGFAALITK